MSTRQLGPFTVSATGFGCMNICHAYSERLTDGEAEKVLKAALDAGITHFDTAALYGFGFNRNVGGKFPLHESTRVHVSQQVRYARR